MCRIQRLKQKHPTDTGGCGVMVASLAFNQAGGGSNPFNLTFVNRSFT